jgi:hypothetical protein
MTTEHKHGTTIPWHSELHKNITLWLEANRHLPPHERTEIVKNMLYESRDFESIIHYAAMSFILLESLIDKCNELPNQFGNILTEAKKVCDHLESERQSQRGKTIKQMKDDRFKATEQNLKQYWLENIPPEKRATDAAILLEKTAIFEQSSAKPKRSTLENYVRKWQKEN